MKNTFTEAQIKTLAEAFKHIETVHPESPAYKKMRELISKLSDSQLESLIASNIRFVSTLCRSEFHSRQRSATDEKAIETLRQMFESVPVSPEMPAPHFETFRKQRNDAMGDAVREHLSPARLGADSITCEAYPANTRKPTQDDLIHFRRRLEAFMEDHHLKNYTNTRNESMELTIGKKYAKISRKGPGVNSVYCFIGLETGDIYKAASWNAPAKHIRGSIFQPDSVLFGDGKCCGPYGIVYLR